MLTLYMKNTCAFSRKVLTYASAANIEIEVKDIYADPEILNELIEHGGKKQVPYLIDREAGIGMYESDDIIDYLKEHHAR